jgi:hypothetical protein
LPNSIAAEYRRRLPRVLRALPLFAGKRRLFPLNRHWVSVYLLPFNPLLYSVDKQSPGKKSQIPAAGILLSCGRREPRFRRR